MVLGRSFPSSGLLTDSDSEQPGHLKALFYGPALHRLTVLWPSYREAETAPWAAAEITANHHEFFLASPSKTLPSPGGICFLGRFQHALPLSSGNSCRAAHVEPAARPLPCPLTLETSEARLCQSGNTDGTAADSICDFRAGVPA